MKKMTVCIPFMNQLHDSKGAMGLLRANTSEDTEIMVIDNGSSDDIETFFTRFLQPKRMNYIRNEENVGLVKTYQQAYENCTTDVLAITHSDVFIYEKNWDQRILSYFDTIPKLGGVGFFGSQGCGPVGERIQDVPSPGMMAGMSNMLEAEQHGFRLTEPWRPAAIFDGFMMIFSMEMLRAGGGFDTRYIYHHIYDRDISLESLRRGYKNIVVDVPCHHWSGMTANRPEYQNWIKSKVHQEDADRWTHDENSRRFAEKFKDVLPIYVETDFSFRSQPSGQWQFRGDPADKKIY